MLYQLFTISIDEINSNSIKNWPYGSLSWSYDKPQIALAQPKHIIQPPGVLGFDLQTRQTAHWNFEAGGKLSGALSGRGWWIASEQGLFQLRWQEPILPLLVTESWPGWTVSHFLKHNPAPPFLLALQSNQQQGRLITFDAQPRIRQKWLISPWNGKDIAPAKNGWWTTRKETSSDSYLAYLSNQGGIQNFEHIFFRNTPISMVTNQSLEQLFCLSPIEIIILDVRNTPQIVLLHPYKDGMRLFWKEPNELWIVNRRDVHIFILEYGLKWKLHSYQSIPITHDILQSNWHPQYGLILQTAHTLEWIPPHDFI